jgi:5-formyltetrahydrofolate cyclo-ligase
LSDRLTDDFDPDMGKSTVTDKAALRRRFLDVRQALDASEKFDADVAIGQHVLQWLRNVQLKLQVDVPGEQNRLDRQNRPLYVAMYRAFRGEADIGRVAGEIRALGWNTAFPVTHRLTRAMSFRLVQDETLWTEGSYGIPEPANGEEVPARDLHVVLLPGVAFTLDGIRLGYGGGYYDRLFAQEQVSAKRMGICYACQMAEHLVDEAHDVRMDLLATEVGVTPCRSR